MTHHGNYLYKTHYSHAWNAGDYKKPARHRLIAISVNLLMPALLATAYAPKAYADDISGPPDQRAAEHSLASKLDVPNDPSKKSLGIPPVKSATTASYDWTGFYVGSHVGYATGRFGPGTNPVPNQSVFAPPTITGLVGGFQAGYNVQLDSNWVLGAETDVTFVSPVDEPKLTPAPFNTTLDVVGTVRGRVGYAFGTFLPYVTGGPAWGRTKLDVNASDGGILSTRDHWHLGWAAGAGIEMALRGPWTARIEYDYLDLGVWSRHLLERI